MLSRQSIMENKLVVNIVLYTFNNISTLSYIQQTLLFLHWCFIFILTTRTIFTCDDNSKTTTMMTTNERQR